MDPSWALLEKRCGEEEDEEEGTGEESKGDCDVEVGLNASISALSVEMEEDVTGKEVSELAVSTPESTDSERRFVPMSEDVEESSS